LRAGLFPNTLHRDHAETRPMLCGTRVQGYHMYSLREIQERSGNTGRFMSGEVMADSPGTDNLLFFRVTRGNHLFSKV
jgi:hypothetical protein